MGSWSLDTIIGNVATLTDTDVSTGSKLPTGGGGTWSEVEVLPSNTQQLPSDAQANQPPALRKVKNLCRDYDKTSKVKCNDWIAGHLTNASWGGDGSDAANMTVLSVSGNNLHKAKFEQKVKTIQFFLYNYYREIQKLSLVGSQQELQDLLISVTVKTQVSSQKHGTTYPFNCVTKSLVCSATLGCHDSKTLLQSLNDIQHNKNCMVNEKPVLDAFFRVSDEVKKLHRVVVDNPINDRTKDLIKKLKLGIGSKKEVKPPKTFKKVSKK